MSGPAPRPKVSVCVVTFNQVQYIRACLQSLVDQETDFPFEIIVGDDCSTDGTSAIVEEFAKNYPDKVVAIRNAINLGPCENYRRVHQLARGQFVAHVDGDDCALAGKLAQGARLLDSAHECVAVFHQLKMVDHTGCDTGRLWPAHAPEWLSADYLLRNHPIFGHSSMMYRNGLLADLLKSNDDFIDFMVYTRLALKGPIAFLNCPLGVYRIGVGISSLSRTWFTYVFNVIDFAESEGVDSQAILSSRAVQFFNAGLNDFYRGRHEEFARLVKISVATKIVSASQVFFFLFRGAPRCLRYLTDTYRTLRNLGIVRDIKMVFK